MENGADTPQCVFFIAKLWVLSVIISLIIFYFLSSPGYMEIDAISIWVLSCIALIYLLNRKRTPISGNHRLLVISLGIFLCIFSFVNIPLGFGNPPYSIGDFSLFLAGMGLVIFSYLGIRTVLLPVAFPAIAVLGFQFYDIIIRHQDWITAPLIPPATFLSVTLLNFIGINAHAEGNLILFLSISGSPIYLSIVSDCTGIWSLGTFTVATAIVLSSFPQAISKKGAILILIGYIGTYIANILRIVLIGISGYMSGPTGLIEVVHVHIGWIVFTSWMIIFWYYFFTRHLGIVLFRKRTK